MQLFDYPATWQLIRLHHVNERLLCSCGNPVCKAPGKHPIGKNWQKGNGDFVKGDNVGVVLGQPSGGLIVLDIDRKNGKDGFALLKSLGWEIPDSLRATTPTGGAHVVMTIEGGYCPKVTKYQTQGIEILGDGNQFVVAPSVTEKGAYIWDNWGAPIAKAPPWVVALVQEKRAEKTALSAPRNPPQDHGVDVAKRVALASRYLANVPGAVSGENGSGRTYRAVCVVCLEFDLPRDVALDLLMREYNPKCSPPWSEQEMIHKVDDAYAKGQNVIGARLIDSEEKEDLLESSREVDLAIEWVRRKGGQDVVRAVGERIYCYNDGSGVWDELSHGDVKASLQSLYHGALYKHVTPKGEETVKQVNLTPRVGDAICTAITRHNPVRDVKFFEDVPKGLAFENGWLDGETFDMTPWTPAQRARFAYDFAYDPNTPCNAWLEFLCSLFEGDHDGIQKIECLQEFLGACMFGRATEYQKALLFLGSGDNGKSTLLDYISTQLFPRAQVGTSDPNRWHQEYHVAELYGRILNYCGEMPIKAIEETASIKGMISGDETTARFIYEGVFRFKPIAGHIFNCQELPTTRDMSPGFWRRFIVMGFNNVFTASDGHQTGARIVENLRRERQGVVAWAIEGAKRLQQNKRYTAYASGEEAKDQWRRDTDNVANFIASCCVRGEGETISKDAYEAYRRFCDKRGDKDAVDRRVFGKRIKMAGIRIRPSHSTIWYGMTVKPALRWQIE